MTITIDYLKNHPDLVEEISRHFYQEWGYLFHDRSLKDFKDSIVERLNYDKIPLALVAVDKGRFIGTICLKEYDMDTRKELSPWLAGLYIKDEYRNIGIGKLLIENISNEALKININELYLFTPSAKDYYKKLGWSTVIQEDYRGINVVIMKKRLR